MATFLNRVLTLCVCVSSLAGPALAGTAYTWTQATPGTYNWESSNWNQAGYPNAQGDTASLPTGGTTWNMTTSPITVGGIAFGNTGGTRINGTTLIFDNGVSNATVSRGNVGTTNGAQMVFTTYELKSTLDYNVTSHITSMLSMQGRFTGPGGLNINAGVGDSGWSGFTLDASDHTYTGGTTINGSGTTLTLNGTIDTPVVMTGGANFRIAKAGAQSSVLGGAISGTGNVMCSGNFTFDNDANSWQGSLRTISDFPGPIKFTSIKNVAAGPSALGNPQDATQGTITMTGGNSSLEYVGSGDSTDRIINYQGFPDWNWTIRASGTTTVASPFRITSHLAGNKTTGWLYLAGTGAGEWAGNLLTANLNQLQKSESGTWTLSGANTYTGPTTISGGTLIVNGSLAGGAVTASAGTSLGGRGTVGGAVTAAAGSAGTPGAAIRLVDGATGTLALGSTLTLNGTSAYPNNLYFELGSSAGTGDRISAGGAVTVANAGGAVIYVQPVGAASIGDGAYTLVSGSSITNPGYFTLGTTRAFGKIFSLGDSGSAKVLTVSPAAAGPAAAFWKGGNDSWSDAGNWNGSLAGGEPAVAAPGYATNVTFATTTPAPTQLTTNLVDSDLEINSLAFNRSGVTIGGANRLTLAATTVNGNPAANGITASNTSGTNTISSKVGLGASQTWTVASGGTLAVSGAISDMGIGCSLTKAGGGTLTLSAANSYSGGTVLSSGRILLDNAAALGSGPVTIQPGTSIGVVNSLTVTGVSQYYWNGNFDTVNTTKNINFGTAPVTIAAPLTLGVANGVTIGGVVSGPGGLNALDISGTGFGGVGYGLTFTAPITLRGTQTVSGRGAAFTGVISDGGAGYGLTLADNVGVQLRAANTFTGPITIGTGATLTLGDGDLGTTGSISPLSPIVNNGTLSFGLSNKNYVQGVDFNSVISGSGNLSMGGHTLWLDLNGLNTFTGSITLRGDGADKLRFNSVKNVGGGPSALGAPTTAANGTIALANYAITYTGSGDTTDRLFTLNGNSRINASGTTTPASPLQITSPATPSGASRTFTLGGSGAGRWAGDMANSGSNVLTLVKADAGTWTLAGANSYTGTTTVNAGTLAFARTASLYNAQASQWTPANLTVAAGATLAVGVGDSAGGYFAPADLDTLLDGSHLGASTATTGLKTGAVLGLDTTNAAGGTFTYNAAITNPGSSGSMALDKLGAGTLVLGGASTYSGPTTVRAGTLQIDGSLGSGGAALAVPAAGTLVLSPGGSIARDVNVSGGSASLAGTLASGTTLKLTGGAIQTAPGPASVAIADLSVPGTGTLTAGTPLAVTNQLKLPDGLTISAGGPAFSVQSVAGSNIADNAAPRTLTLSGGTVTMGQNGGRLLPIAATPKAWYRFDDAGNFGLDSSGNNHHMNLSGSPAGVPAGRFDGAISFDHAAGNQKLQLDGTGWTSLQNALSPAGGATGQTAILWVKKTAAQVAQQNTSGILMGLGTGSNSHYTWDNTNAYFNAFGSDRIDNIPAPSSAVQQAWVMIAIVRDPATGRAVYFNPASAAASPAATKAASTLAWGSAFRLGQNESNLYLGGQMDEVMLFNQALSVADLAALYNDPGTYSSSVVTCPATHIALAADSTLNLGSPAGHATLGNLSLGTSALTIQNAASVSFADISGTGSVAGNLSARGTLAPGASVGQFTVEGDLTVQDGAIYAFEVGQNQADQIVVTGELAFEGDWTILLQDAGDARNDGAKLYLFLGAMPVNMNLGNWRLDDSLVPDWDLTGVSLGYDQAGVYLDGLRVGELDEAIPEPVTMILLGLGGAGLGGYVRRRRTA